MKFLHFLEITSINSKQSAICMILFTDFKKTEIILLVFGWNNSYVIHFTFNKFHGTKTCEF